VLFSAVPRSDNTHSLMLTSHCHPLCTATNLLLLLPIFLSVNNFNLSLPSTPLLPLRSFSRYSFVSPNSHLFLPPLPKFLPSYLILIIILLYLPFSYLLPSPRLSLSSPSIEFSSPLSFLPLFWKHTNTHIQRTAIRNILTHT